MFSRADRLFLSVTRGTSEGVTIHLTCEPSLEHVYLRLAFSRCAARGQQQQQPALHAPPVRDQAEWDSSVAAVRAHLARANGERCCGHMNKQCAVVLRPHEQAVRRVRCVLDRRRRSARAAQELRGPLRPLREVKLRASSRNRPLLWALTSGKSLPQDEALCWAHTGRPFSHTPSHSARFRR